MIQDIEPQKLHNEYMDRTPEPNDYVLTYSDGKILVRDGKKLEYLTYQEYARHGGREAVYLFSVDEKRFFLARSAVSSVDGYHYCPMHEVRQYSPKEQVLAAATGWHLFLWYQNNRFCGRCGKPTIHDEKQRMLKCSCGNMIFPKIAPAVIVGVTKGDEILLTKYANRTYTRYALIAGFTEIGETAEETVRREVMEEVGLKVKHITYYKSQPWGFDSNLLFGFFCEVDGDSGIRLDREELAVGEWVRRQDVPAYTEGLSLTHEMMDVFRTGKEHISGLSGKAKEIDGSEDII